MSESKPLRVLVCGSRSRSGCRAVYRRLGELPNDVVLIEGGSSGVDSDARHIAEGRGWKVETVEAEWTRYGRKAGPMRNQAMIDSKPDLVLAFPADDSVGTYDTIQRAKAAGIPYEVIHV